MFYGIIQRGLDKWNASFFCGSAAVLRRKALNEAGGFSGLSITEDCETALELHSRGWNSVYVDKPLIAGPAAGDLRQLHRPAQPLGAGHDADPAIPFPAAQARPRCRSALLHVVHAVLAVPVPAHDLPVRAAASTCSSTWRSSRHPAASSSPTRSPTCS
jgi:cellulose synthase/poly-beta-1,6-N-acetylglucosamine synthase-like glycosyltransferase